jgi:hypothetical protein
LRAGVQPAYLRWGTGCGKTELLRQFCLKHRDRTIAYFVGRDTYSSHAESFQFDVCQQVLRFLGLDELPLAASYDQVRQVLPRAWARFASEARSVSEPHYLVIDSFDLGRPDSSGQALGELLPRLGRNVRLLLSGAAEPASLRGLPAATTLDLPMFGEVHTSRYLEDLDLSDKTIQVVQEATGGRPAYVAEVRRRLEATAPDVRSRVIASLPRDLEGLLEREWATLEFSPDDRVALAVLAFAPCPLTVPVWSQVVSRPEEDLENLVRRGGFLRIEGSVAFISGVHADFVASRLQDEKAGAKVLLVDHYRSQPTSPDSLRFLPALMVDLGDYNTLKALIDTTYLIGSFRGSRDLSLLRSGTGAAIDASVRTGDVAKAAFLVGAESAVTSAYGRVDAIETELVALCSLGDWTGASDLAEGLLLPQDQAQAFAVIAAEMQQQEAPLPDSLVPTIDLLVDRIPAQISAMEAIQIARRIFRARPQAAVSLLERCLGPSGSDAVDRALVALSLSYAPSSDALGLVHSKLGSQVAREVLVSHVVARGVTADQLLASVSQLDSPASKIGAIRTWCNGHRDDHGAPQVVRRALEIVFEETSFTPSVRQLRQICEPLRKAALSEAEPIVLFFATFRAGLPKHPWLENLRLDLLLAEVSSTWDHQAASLEFDRIANELESETDLQRQCLGKAHLLAAMHTSAVPFVASKLQTLKTALACDFEQLLLQTADHTRVAQPIVAAVARFDAATAAVMALELNYPERRDAALEDVVTVQARRGQSADIDSALSACAAIESPIVRARALQSLIRSLAASATAVAPAHVDRCRRLTDGLPSAAERALCLGRLAAWQASSGMATSEIAELAIGEAGAVDDPWNRRQVLCQLAIIIQTTDRALGASILRSAQGESVDSRTDAHYGPVFATAIHVAASACRRQDDPGAPCSVRVIRERISMVPSNWVQVDLLGVLASRLFLRNERDLANSLVREMLDRLDLIRDQQSRMLAIARSLSPFAEYDAAVARRLASELPREWKNSSALRVLSARLASKPADIPIDLDKMSVRASHDSVTRAAEMLRWMDADWALVAGMQAIADAIGPRQVPPILAPRTVEALANDWTELIGERLPDVQGIKHSGFVVLAKAQVQRLRETARRLPDAEWDALLNEAQAIPNVADSTYVSAQISQDLGRSRSRVALKFAEAADQLCPGIATDIDRLSRAETLAAAYHELGENARARATLLDAIARAGVLAREDADARFDRLLDIAELVDGELASVLTSQLDSVAQRFSLEERRQVNKVRRRPAAIIETVSSWNGPDFPYRETASALRTSHASGRLGAQARPVVLDVLSTARGRDLFEVMDTLIWVSENAATANWEEQGAIADALLAVVDFAFNLGEAVIAPESELTSTSPTEAVGLTVFRAGDSDGAREGLTQLLRAHEGPHLTWVDPYFRAEQVPLLHDVPIGVSIRIFANESAQRDALDRKIGRDDVRASFEAAWGRRYDEAPPNVTVYLLGTSGGKSPLHDRYLLSACGGYKLGTSANGFGALDTSCQALSAEQAAVEMAEVDRWLLAGAPLLSGEPVRVASFTLD